MKLNEYHTKLHLAAAGIPVPHGRMAETPAQAGQIATELATPVYVKAQVPLSGRLQLQGVQYAHNTDEAFAIAEAMFNRKIKGLSVQRVLIEQAIETIQELYLGITYDRAAGKPLLIISSEGGAELESIAAEKPETVFQERIAPLIGLRGYQITTIASKLNLHREIWPHLQQIALALYSCFIKTDAELMEVNPLAVTTDHQLVALDAKMIVDENALFRQPDIQQQYLPLSESPEEALAYAAALRYVKLEGQIGCVFNGAGIAMAMMDLIYMYGDNQLKPANFLDIGGNTDLEVWKTGLRLVLQDPDVQCVLINVFGGTTRCDDAARALITVCIEQSNQKPIVVRLRGTNASVGTQIITDAQLPGIYFAGSLTQAVVMAIQLASED